MFSFLQQFKTKKKIKELKEKLEHGELIQINDNNIDTLSLLVDCAERHNLGIVVGSQMKVNAIKNMNENIRIYRLAKNFTFEVKKADNDCILIDESIDLEMIKWLKQQPNITICGGFIKGEE